MSVRKQQGLFAMFALTLGVAALYAFRLDAASLRGDEGFTALCAQWSLPAIVEGLRTIIPHPPLYHLFMRGWVALLGGSDLVLRWPSLVAGVLVAPLCYATGRHWAGERTGLWAAALAALNPFLLWHAQDARMYAILAATSLASVGFAVRLLEDRPRARGLWLGYVLTTLLAAATHYYALFLVLAENLAFLLSWVRGWHGRRTTLRWLAAQAVMALLILPWLLFAGGAMLGHAKDWIPAVSLWEYARRLALAFSLGTTIEMRHAWPWLLIMGALLLVGLAWSLGLGRRRERGAAEPPIASAMLWAALWVPLGITFILSLWRPAFDERYLIGCAPIYLLFVARGLAWVGQRRRWAAWALAAFIALGSAYSIYQYHYAPQHAKSSDWRGLVEYVVAQARPGDLLLINYPDPTQEYYNGGRLDYALLPAEYPVDVADTLAELARLAEEHPRLWLVPVRAGNWDRDLLVQGWLDRYADLERVQSFQGLEARLYHTAQRYTQTMRPVGLDLGGAIRLLGYDLRVEGERLEGDGVALGGQLVVTLYWEPLAEIGEDYTVFVQLLDPTGYLRGQQDSPPFGGAYLTSAWQVGERLVDRYTITVDPSGPAGTYQLVAGMYRWPSIERLPVTDAAGKALGDHMSLGQVRVK